MSNFAANTDHLLDLAGAVCNEAASRGDLAELRSILLADGAACRRYLFYCEMHAALRFEVQADRAAQAVCQQIGIQMTVQTSHETDIRENGISSKAPNAFLSNFVNGPAGLGYFPEGMPLAYLLATVIVGFGLLIGSRIYVSGPERVARDLSPATKDRATRDSQMPFVGRITGMVDCQWADPQTEAFNSANVPLGRRYALSSGLMEITYDTGAKVILQGPVTYESDSNGGFLSVGKLTGKLEKKPNSPRPSDGRGAGGEGGESSNSSFILHPSSFVIRTPTATVTDLGTEFGVEVSKEGGTTSHVFRGSVRMRLVGTEKSDEGVMLGENESGWVEKNGDKQVIVLGRTIGTTEGFLREMPAAQKASSLQVMGYFHLGEDDPGAVADELGGDVSRQQSQHMDVKIHGSPRYSDAVAAPGSRLAVHFGGNGDWYVGPYVLTVETDNFGIEAWVKPDDNTSTGAIASNGNQGWSLLQRGDTLCGYLACDQDNVAPKPGKGFGGDVGAFKFTPGQWYHVAMVRDRGLATFYVNGEAVGTNTQEPWIPQGRFWIGCYNGFPTRCFHGSIDEVRVFEFKPGKFRVDDLLLPASRKGTLP